MFYFQGLNEADIYNIPLVVDSNRNAFEENKISSSSMRKRTLATLRRPPNVSYPRLSLSVRSYYVILIQNIAGTVDRYSTLPDRSDRWHCKWQVIGCGTFREVRCHHRQLRPAGYDHSLVL